MKKVLIYSILFSLIFVLPVSSYDPNYQWTIFGPVMQVGTWNGETIVVIKHNNELDWEMALNTDNRNEMYIAAVTALTTGYTVIAILDTQINKCIDLKVVQPQP